METWWCGGDGVCLVKQPSPSEAPVMAADDALLPSSEEAHFIQERGKKQQVGVETSRFLDVVDES